MPYSCILSHPHRYKEKRRRLYQFYIGSESYTTMKHRGGTAVSKNFFEIPSSGGVTMMDDDVSLIKILVSVRICVV